MPGRARYSKSMSALPIILKQNSVSVGLFTLLRERELGLLNDTAISMDDVFDIGGNHAATYSLLQLQLGCLALRR